MLNSCKILLEIKMHRLILMFNMNKNIERK